MVAADTPAALMAGVGDQVVEVEGPDAERAANALQRAATVRMSIRTERGYRLGITGAHEGIGAILGAAPRVTRLDVRRATLEDVYFAKTLQASSGTSSGRVRWTIGMSALATIHAIVVRDLARAFRQKSRIVGGLARPFMWLLLVGSGYNAISRVEGAVSYQASCFREWS